VAIVDPQTTLISKTEIDQEVFQQINDQAHPACPLDHRYKMRHVKGQIAVTIRSVPHHYSRQRVSVVDPSSTWTVSYLCTEPAVHQLSFHQNDKWQIELLTPITRRIQNCDGQLLPVLMADIPRSVPFHRYDARERS
jgi:hypothetical protein